MSDRIDYAEVERIRSAPKPADELARFLPIAPFAPLVLPATWYRREPPSGERELQACYSHLRAPLTVLMSARREHDERRWLHVSVSHARRLPDWDDLREVKNLFVGRDRLALQVLPRAAEHVNIHPRVLHLWSCLDGDPVPDFRIIGAV